MASEMPLLLDPSKEPEKKSYDKKNLKFVQLDMDVYKALQGLKEERRVASIKEFVSSILRVVLTKEYRVEVGE